MKRLLPLIFASLSAPAQPHSDVEISFEEETESRCPSARAELVAELRSRLPEFRATWNRIGPAMSQAVTEVTGKPFSPAGKVRLTLCEVPSNSFFGATVNMRYALQSFTSTPVPLRYKVDTAFHELLHGFVAQHVAANSPLLALHASEPYCVRNHLHLLALQKAVLVRLNDRESLTQVISIDSQLPSGCYRRAWAVVNETEIRYKQFISELAQ